jgi:hypothetical protein
MPACNVKEALSCFAGSQGHQRSRDEGLGGRTRKKISGAARTEDVSRKCRTNHSPNVVASAPTCVITSLEVSVVMSKCNRLDYPPPPTMYNISGVGG